MLFLVFFKCLFIAINRLGTAISQTIDVRPRTIGRLLLGNSFAENNHLRRCVVYYSCVNKLDIIQANVAVKICNATKFIFELSKVGGILMVMISGINPHCEAELFHCVGHVYSMKFELLLRRYLIPRIRLRFYLRLKLSIFFPQFANLICPLPEQSDLAASFQ